MDDDAATDATGALFLDRSRHLLTDEYLPKLERAMEVIGEENLWWRPNEASNAAGNLLLHMAGSLRQWVVSGVAGAEDIRRRNVEFAAMDGATAEQLMGALEATVDEAVGVLADLDPGRLTEPASVQGRETTVLGAIYHAVEHFGMHTGQLLYLAKLRSGQDLGLYADDDGIPRGTWR